MRIRLFLGMWAVLTCVVGLTVVANDRLDLGGGGSDQVVSGPDGTGGSSSSTDPDPAVAPSPGQVRVHGTVTALHLDGAALDPDEVATPLTIVSDRGFGNGGELTGVEVDGHPSSIVWDGGRPFVLSSGGAVVLDPVVVDLVPEGLRLALGGAAHSLTPGSYRLDTPVAVGAAGIATPMDAVTFTATAHTLFEARGDASLVLGPGAARHLTGRGRAQLDGALDVTGGSGPRAVTTLTVTDGTFDLTFTLAPGGGWMIDGIVDEPGVG